MFRFSHNSDQRKSDMTKYWHELTKEEIEAIPGDMLASELQKKYSQPPWCSDDGAIHQYGCWSLVGNNRAEISVDYCKTCDCFKPYQ